MRVRAIAVTASLGCLGACTDGAPASCYLEDVIDRRIGLTYVDDCGAVGPDDPEAAFTAAHDCAVAHASAGEPFLVQWEQAGIDSRIASAVIGVRGELYWIQYDSSPGGGGDEPAAATFQCSALVDLGTCGDAISESLCLDCADAVRVSVCVTNPADQP